MLRSNPVVAQLSKKSFSSHHPKRSSPKSVTLSPAVKLQTDRSFLLKGKPFHSTPAAEQRSLCDSNFLDTSSPCSITFTETWHAEVLVRVTKSRFMGAYRSITQPPAIRGPVRTPKKSQLVMWKLEIKSGNQCAHAPRCARLCCAVSSATGVRNKVRFLHGHHKFPNALQLIAHAAEKKRRDGMRRGGGTEGALQSFYASSNTSEKSEGEE